MKKTILVTGATDGIGLETAKALVIQGHNVIVHGRTPNKVESVVHQLMSLKGANSVDSIVADLSHLPTVENMAAEIIERFNTIDVLINNAGVYSSSIKNVEFGLDIRFVVNAISPYILTSRLLPQLLPTARIVNLSSAAQTSVDIGALKGTRVLSDGEAYAQSKLALTMWSHALGLSLKENGPMIVSVNPKSLLGSKMVKEAYGIAGGSLKHGADILVRAALSDEFALAHGQYYDNDIAQFALAHPDVYCDEKTAKLVENIEQLILKCV